MNLKSSRINLAVAATLAVLTGTCVTATAAQAASCPVTAEPSAQALANQLAARIQSAVASASADDAEQAVSDAVTAVIAGASPQDAKAAITAVRAQIGCLVKADYMPGATRALDAANSVVVALLNTAPGATGATGTFGAAPFSGPNFSSSGSGGGGTAVTHP